VSAQTRNGRHLPRVRLPLQTMVSQVTEATVFCFLGAARDRPQARRSGARPDRANVEREEIQMYVRDLVGRR
jgi:hypothetical protein